MSPQFCMWIILSFLDFRGSCLNSENGVRDLCREIWTEYFLWNKSWCCVFSGRTAGWYRRSLWRDESWQNHWKWNKLRCIKWCKLKLVLEVFIEFWWLWAKLQPPYNETDVVSYFLHQPLGSPCYADRRPLEKIPLFFWVRRISSPPLLHTNLKRHGGKAMGWLSGVPCLTKRIVESFSLDHWRIFWNIARFAFYKKKTVQKIISYEGFYEKSFDYRIRCPKGVTPDEIRDRTLLLHLFHPGKLYFPPKNLPKCAHETGYHKSSGLPSPMSDRPHPWTKKRKVFRTSWSRIQRKKIELLKHIV